MRSNSKMDLRYKGKQSGIALLLVIGSIVILTMIGVEFAYDAQVEYHQAVHERERLQAYYLALSAYNLIRLELKLGTAVQSQVAEATASQNIKLPIDLSEPLCQQFPMKTALFRLYLTGETGTKEAPSEEGKSKPNDSAKEALASLPLQGVEEFLQFDGDFDGECVDESSKIDLNFFYSQDPSKRIEGKDNAYDEYKKFIIGVLSGTTYQDLFKKTELKIPEVVRNIADWIDPNESISEFGGSEGSSEDSEYRGGVSGQMTTKNGKLSVPGDIYQVAGVEDSWWIPVSELFTIYGLVSDQGKPQINVCRASNEVVTALILRYTETRTDLPPLKGDDKEILDQLVKTVKGGCTGAIPDKNKIAQDLDAFERIDVGVQVADLEALCGQELG